MSHRGTAQPGARFSGMLDARERVDAEIEFSIDVKVPGMLQSAILRSTSPHARIARLDVEAARSLPGVHAVVTGAEIAARGDVRPRFGPVGCYRVALAGRVGGEPQCTVRYIGRTIRFPGRRGRGALDTESSMSGFCPKLRG